MLNHKQLLYQARKIAIVRTDRIGDMILTLPMFRVLHLINPSADLYLISRKYTEPVFKGVDEISDYFLIDNNSFHNIFKINKFDVVFFPHPVKNEIFSAYKNKIPLRVGSGYRWYSFFLNHRVYEHRKYAEKNEAEFNLDLISDITGEKYNVELIPPKVDNNSLEKINHILKNKNIEKFIIIHPGGGKSAPCWSAENFAKLAQMIEINYNLFIIITGTDEEEDLCNTVEKNLKNSINLCGNLSLDDTIALISKCDTLISNSTGVIHIAAAFDKKILGFYPNSLPMSAKRWGPMNNKNIILTPHYNNIIDKDNLDLITFDDAFNSFQKLINL
ncbi:MAG: glycosyltransferase family 9 protein [Candidatus Kapabacteria bacterium]|nr:glycosyltransferase family 9 protein [Candidatus Kapabacteria bacterium]